MFIENINELKDALFCDVKLGKFIESKGIPVLGKFRHMYVFATTDEVREVLQNRTWLEKMMYGNKWEVRVD